MHCKKKEFGERHFGWGYEYGYPEKHQFTGILEDLVVGNLWWYNTGIFRAEIVENFVPHLSGPGAQVDKQLLFNYHNFTWGMTCANIRP